MIGFGISNDDVFHWADVGYLFDKLGNLGLQKERLVELIIG
ncbi:hypothetical protein [Fischerella thermalis]|nr:hypothetical protein [Fischerella thermalis]